MFDILEITKREMTVLLKKGIIRNTHRGFVSSENSEIGFYRTKNKRYIEDSYAIKAQELILNSKRKK